MPKVEETPMADSPATLTEPVDAVEAAPVDAVVEDLAEDVLVEEVSIDGMCGVY
jgi:mycofactocin precursor